MKPNTQAVDFSCSSVSDSNQDKAEHLIGTTTIKPNGTTNTNDKKTGPTNFNYNHHLRRVCYFRLDPKTGIQLYQVDGQLCTHLILAFAHINSQAQLVVSHECAQYLEQVREFKRQHPRVKVMISIENEELHNGFPMLANANNELRYQFARSAVGFCQKYHLDGLDIHWEFPNFPANFFPVLRSSRGELERVGLTKILKALRSAIVENFFDRQLAEQHEMTRAARARAYNTQTEVISHVEPYLLTLAIGGQETILRSSYELKQVINLCDWLNVMSYDYFLFKAYSPFTGPMSPLHPIVDPFVPFLSKLSLDWTVQRLLDEGIEREKLVMGIPSYARAYRLIFRNTMPAPFTLAVGTRGGELQDDCLNYREVLEIIKREDTIVEFDDKARVPYLLTDGGYTWISYEDTQSVREKVRYIIDNKLGGYMTWNLNSDDFIGYSDGDESEVNMDTRSNGFTSHDDTNRSVQLNFPLHRAMLDESQIYVPS